MQLICIDGSNFIDRDNPATKIYTEMVRGRCPRSEDGLPRTMLELQAYWDLLESDRCVVLVFYKNPIGRQPQGFSEVFLNALSAFDGAICVVTEQPECNLKQFSSREPHLVKNLVGWITTHHLD